MQAPQRSQPVRGGPSPPKKGSGAVTPGSPKYTAQEVRTKVSGTPIAPAISRSSFCPSLSCGTGVAPSMRSAVS